MNTTKESIKAMREEILKHCEYLGCLPDEFETLENKTFQVEHPSLWNKKNDRIYVQKWAAYNGISFTYANGTVTFQELSNDTYARKYRLQQAASQQYYLRTKVKVKNKKIDKLIEELEGYEEIPTPSFPFETKGSDVVIGMFPKDTPEKDFADFEVCDVIIYDRDYQEYFKVKTMRNGFSEVFTGEVQCRTGLMDGGYIVRLREGATIDVGEDRIIYLYKEGTKIESEFSQEELEDALVHSYGKSFKDIK